MEGSGLSKVQVLRGALAEATRGSEPARPQASSLARSGGTVQKHLHMQVRPFKSSRMDGCARPGEERSAMEGTYRAPAAPSDLLHSEEASRWPAIESLMHPPVLRAT